MNPSTRADAATCAALTRRHARTFSLASRFLPPDKRRAAFAVYAFCRIADDIVDHAAPERVDDARRALEAHRTGLVAALRGHPTGATFRELAWAIDRFGIPHTPFHHLLNTLAWDLRRAEVVTWSDLARYCGGVASTVGEMCAFVFGLPRGAGDRALALDRARTLGVALQLTNILRDVGEDAERGRCYLPSSELSAFGLTRGAVLARVIDPRDARWRDFMRFQIARARRLYADAAPGLAQLPSNARWCATICSDGYAMILGAIERRVYDCIAGRARIGAARKALVICRAWVASRRAAAAADSTAVASPATAIDAAALDTRRSARA